MASTTSAAVVLHGNDGNLHAPRATCRVPDGSPYRGRNRGAGRDHVVHDDRHSRDCRRPVHPDVAVSGGVRQRSLCGVAAGRARAWRVRVHRRPQPQGPERPSARPAPRSSARTDPASGRRSFCRSACRRRRSLPGRWRRLRSVVAQPAPRAVSKSEWTTTFRPYLVIRHLALPAVVSGHRSRLLRARRHVRAVRWRRHWRGEHRLLTHLA